MPQSDLKLARCEDFSKCESRLNMLFNASNHTQIGVLKCVEQAREIWPFLRLENPWDRFYGCKYLKSRSFCRCLIRLILFDGHWLPILPGYLSCHYDLAADLSNHAHNGNGRSPHLYLFHLHSLTKSLRFVSLFFFDHFVSHFDQPKKTKKQSSFVLNFTRHSTF